MKAAKLVARRDGLARAVGVEAGMSGADNEEAQSVRGRRVNIVARVGIRMVAACRKEVCGG